jgi:hypothetical protein
VIDCAYESGGTACSNNCCAWPRSLASWLKAVRPSWNIEITNNALRGVGVEAWATAALPAADAYIIATSVNSQALASDVIVKSGLQLVERLQRRLTRRLSQAIKPAPLSSPPPILWLSEFRTCSHDINDCHFHCGNETMEDGRGHFFCPHWWRVADIESEVLSMTGLPRANYRNAVWPSLSTPPNLATVWGKGLSHPSPGPQELISDTVKYAFSRLYALYKVGEAGFSASCSFSETGNTGSLKSYGATCKTRSNFVAREIFSGAGTSGTWGLREDVPGKAGWIADGLRTPGATKSFEVDISAGAGSNPVVVIYYLTSYERMGTAVLLLTAPLSDGATCSASVTLSGKSSTHTSVTTPFAWAMAEGDADWPAACAPERLQPTSFGSGYARARIDLVDDTGVGKFKLLGLRTC